MSDEPSMFERLKRWKTETLPERKCLVQASWRFEGASSIDHFDDVPCPPSPYGFYLTLTGGGLGCCYSEVSEAEDAPAWIGKDARAIRGANRYREVSLLDSVFGNFRPAAVDRFWIDGASQEKSEARAEIIAGQVEKQAAQRGVTRPRVVMVGVVGRVMSAMEGRGMRVCGVDMSEELIGQQSGGVCIASPDKTEELIAEADIALITGMAIVNDTMEGLLMSCRRAGAEAIIYGQTGSNFAPFYLENGVSCVISESFPLYTVRGRSEIRIFANS